MLKELGKKKKKKNRAFFIIIFKKSQDITRTVYVWIYVCIVCTYKVFYRGAAAPKNKNWCKKMGEGANDGHF